MVQPHDGTYSFCLGHSACTMGVPWGQDVRFATIKLLLLAKRVFPNDFAEIAKKLRRLDENWLLKQRN